jgi:hypothetical protein
VAVFRTENEVGIGARLVGGVALLAMAIFGLVPVRFKVGDNEVWVARAALRAIMEVAKATGSATQEEIVDGSKKSWRRTVSGAMVRPPWSRC